MLAKGRRLADTGNAPFVADTAPTERRPPRHNGPSQILFGSDFPFAPEVITKVSVEGLAGFDGFDDSALRMIERANALALLPQLRARLQRHR